MIICPTCSKENADEAWHCGYCGTKLRGKVTNTMFGMAIPQNEVERLRQMHAARGAGGDVRVADAIKVRGDAQPGAPLESILSEEGWDLEGLGQENLDAFDEGWELGNLDEVLSDTTPEELSASHGVGDDVTHSAIFKTRKGKADEADEVEGAPGDEAAAGAATDAEVGAATDAAAGAATDTEAAELEATEPEATEPEATEAEAAEPPVSAATEEAPASPPEPKRTMLGFPAPAVSPAGVAHAAPPADEAEATPASGAAAPEPAEEAAQEKAAQEKAAPEPRKTVMGLGPMVPARPPRDPKATTPAGQQADAGLSGGAGEVSSSAPIPPSPDLVASRRSGPAVAPGRRRAAAARPEPASVAPSSSGSDSDMTPILVGLAVLAILATVIGVAVKVWG